MKKNLKKLLLAFFLFLLPAVACAAITDNIVDYYTLDGNSTDSLGTHNGTDSNMSYSTGNGKINQGGGFNGTNSEINMAALPFSGSSNFTMACWVKSSTTATRQAIMTIGNESNTINQRVFLFINSSNQLASDLNQSAGPHSTATLTDGNFHFAALTNTAGTFQLYVDSTADGSQGKSPNISGSEFTIGSDSSTPGSGNQYNGSIDECGVWSRALSGAEITSLYNGGAGIQYPFVASVVTNDDFNWWLGMLSQIP